MDAWSGMAGLWGTRQRGVSLGCRLGEMCPYSRKALFEFPLSWKFSSRAWRHQSTDLQGCCQHSSSGFLGWGQSSLQRRCVGSGTRVGCRSLPHQARPVCPGSHGHFFHRALSLGSCRPHTGGFHPRSSGEGKGLPDGRWALSRTPVPLRLVLQRNTAAENEVEPLLPPASSFG